MTGSAGTQDGPRKVPNFCQLSTMTAAKEGALTALSPLAFRERESRPLSAETGWDWRLVGCSLVARGAPSGWRRRSKNPRTKGTAGRCGSRRLELTRRWDCPRERERLPEADCLRATSPESSLPLGQEAAPCRPRFDGRCCGTSRRTDAVNPKMSLPKCWRIPPRAGLFTAHILRRE